MRLLMRALQANKRGPPPTRKSAGWTWPDCLATIAAVRPQCANPRRSHGQLPRPHPQCRDPLRQQASAGRPRIHAGTIAASRARLDRLGDRVPLAPSLSRARRRSRRRIDRMDARQSPRARRDPLLPWRRLRTRFSSRLSRHGRAPRGTDALRRGGNRLPVGTRTRRIRPRPTTPSPRIAHCCRASKRRP